MATEDVLAEALSGDPTAGRSLEEELKKRGIDRTPRELELLLFRALLSVPVIEGGGGGFTEEEERVLAAGGLGADLTPPPTAGFAVAHSAAEYAALVAGSLNVERAAEALGISEGRVRQRLAGGSLYGLKEPFADPARSPWVVPVFQFADGRALPGLGEVAPEIDRSLHPPMVARWFREPNDELIPEDAGGSGAGEEPLSPRDWLLRGLPPRRVALLARHLGEIP